MKYKSGDKVKIRQWDDMALEFGVDDDGDIKMPIYFIKDMQQFCGRIVTIKNRCVGLDNEEYYDIVEDIEQGFCFSDDMLSDVAGDAIVDVRVQLRGQCYDWQGRVIEDTPMDMPVHGQGSGTFVRTVTMPHLPDSLFARLYDGLSVDVILK